MSMQKKSLDFIHTLEILRGIFIDYTLSFLKLTVLQIKLCFKLIIPCGWATFYPGPAGLVFQPDRP